VGGDGAGLHAEALLNGKYATQRAWKNRDRFTRARRGARQRHPVPIHKHRNDFALWAIYERGSADCPPAVTAHAQPKVNSRCRCTPRSDAHTSHRVAVERHGLATVLMVGDRLMASVTTLFGVQAVARR
jgi:hypothetical protein